MENGNYGHESNPHTAGEHCDKIEVSVSSHSPTKTWDTSFRQLRDFWTNSERGGSTPSHGSKSLVSVAPVPEVRHENNTQSNNANLPRCLRGNKKYCSEDGDLVTGRQVSFLEPQLQYDIDHPDENSNYIRPRKHHKIYRHHAAEEMIHPKSAMRDIHPGNDVSRPMNGSHEPTHANSRKHSDSIEHASSRNQRRNSINKPQHYFVYEKNGSIYKDIALDGARIINDRYSHEARSSVPHVQKSAIGSRRESSSEKKRKGSQRGYPPSITESQQNSRLRTTYDVSNQRHPHVFKHTKDSNRSGIQGNEFNSRTSAYATSLSHETQRSSLNARDLQHNNAPMANEGKTSRHERSILYDEGSRIPSEPLHNVSDFYDDVEDERGRITQEPATLSGFHRESLRGDVSSESAYDNWCPVREAELIYDEAIDPRNTARSKERNGSVLISYAPQGREEGGRRRSKYHERTLDQTFERGSQKVNREPISTEEQIYRDSEFQSNFPQNGAVNGRRHESHRVLHPSRRSNNNESEERRKPLINRAMGSNGEVIFEDRFHDPSIDYTLERRKTRPETFRMASFSGEDRDRSKTQRSVEMENEPHGDMTERRRSSTVKPRSREQSLRYSHGIIHVPGESGSLRASRGGTEQLDEYITQQRRTTLDERRVTSDLQRQPAVSHLIEAEKYNEFRDVSTEMVDDVKRGTYDEQRSIPGSQKSSAEQEDGSCNPMYSKLVLKQGAEKLGSTRDDSAQKSLSIERESLGTEEAVIPRKNMRISDNSYYTKRPVYHDEEVDHVTENHRDSRDSVITSRAIDRGSLYDGSLSEVSEPVYEGILPMDKVEFTKHSLNPTCQCVCQDLVQRVHSQRTERSTHSDIPVARLSKSRSKPEEITDGEKRTIYAERNSVPQTPKRISHADDYDYDYAYDDDESDDYDNDDEEEDDDYFEEGSRKTAISERHSESMSPREILRSSQSSTDLELLEFPGANREGSSIYEELKDLDEYIGSSQRASEDYRIYSSHGSELKDQRRYASDGRTSDLKYQRKGQMKHYDTADRVKQTLDDSTCFSEIHRISPYQDTTADDRKSRHLDSDLKERQHLRTDDEADLRRHSRRITEHSYPEYDYISRRESHKVYDKPLVFRKTIGDPESITESHGISVQPVEGIGKKSTLVGEGGRRYTSQATEFESPSSTIHDRTSERTTERESQKKYLGLGTFRRQTVDNSRSLTEVHRTSRQKPGSIGDKLTHIGSDDTSHDKEFENVNPLIIHERIPDRASEKESQEIYDQPGIFKRQITDNVQSVNEVRRFSKMKAGSVDKTDSALAQPDAREYTSQVSAIEHPRPTTHEIMLDRRTEKESQKIYDEPRNFKRQTFDDSESLNEDQGISRQQAGSVNKRRSALTRSGVRKVSYSGQLDNPASPIPEKISKQRGESHDVFVDPASFKRRKDDDSEHPNELHRISRHEPESMEERRSVPDGPDVRRYTNRVSEVETPRRLIVRGRSSDHRTERENQKIYEERGSYLRETIDDTESRNKIQRHSRQRTGYIDNDRSAVNTVFRRPQGRSE